MCVLGMPDIVCECWKLLSLKIIHEHDFCNPALNRRYDIKSSITHWQNNNLESLEFRAHLCCDTFGGHHLWESE